MKEILYYNPKTKQMTLKSPLDDMTASIKIATKLAFEEILEGKKMNLSKEELHQMVEDEKHRQATIKLMESDEFDLELAYALLKIEITLGSKRKREKAIQIKYGSMLTPETYRSLVIMMAIDEYMTHDLERRTYECYKEYVASIYANDKKKDK